MRKVRDQTDGFHLRPSRYYCWPFSLPTESLQKPAAECASLARGSRLRIQRSFIFPALLARFHQAPPILAPRLPELPDRSRSGKNLRSHESPSPTKHGLSAQKFYPEQEFTFEELVSYLSMRCEVSVGIETFIDRSKH